MSIPGSNIRLLREQRGLSVRALATAAKVDYTVLSRLERGLGGYSREGIERIARELDVSLGVLFAEPDMVEAAALRMRRLPVLSPEQLFHWKVDGFDPDEDQEFLHIALDRGSRHQFGLVVPDNANAPELRKGDVVIFDAARNPSPVKWVVAQDETAAIFIGRFRPINISKSTPHFEVVPADLSFPIAASMSSPGLKLRGTLNEMRRSFPF